MTKSCKNSDAQLHTAIAHQIDRLSRQLDINMLTGAAKMPIDGIGATATMVLQRLDQIAPATVGELVKDMRRDASQVTRAIRHLEDHDFVIRAPSRDDARKIILDIKPAGREYLAHTNALLDRESAKLLQNLSLEEKRDLLMLMVRIFEAH